VSGFSPAELSAARLDGHLVELGEAYIPADAVETRELRAGSLRRLLGETLARLTSARRGCTAPRRAAGPPHRSAGGAAEAASGDRRRLVYRDLSVDPDDLVTIGGVSVTVPVRTLADLSRVADADHVRAARLMADAMPGLAAQGIGWLHSHGALPNKRAALVFLRQLEQCEASAGIRKR
jgi:hypothetical protein